MVDLNSFKNGCLMFISLLKLVTTDFWGIIYFMGALLEMDTEVCQLTQGTVNFLFLVKKKTQVHLSIWFPFISLVVAEKY